MTRFQNQFTAAFAALFIVSASFVAMFNVPTAQAQPVSMFVLA